MVTKPRGKSLSINQAISLLGLLGLFTLLMLAGIGLLGMQAMQESANQMGQGKDVVADILPPPLYMIEAELVNNDLLQASATQRQPLLDKLHTLKKDYDTRNQYWEASDLEQDVKVSLLGEQRKYADLFWKEVLEVFIPAIQADNLEAARASAQKSRIHYEAHRKGVDATVGLSNKYAGSKLDALTATATQSYWRLAIAAGLGCVLMVLLALPIFKGLSRRLHVVGDIAAAIASGDLTQVIPAGGKDKIGELVDQIAAMRDNLRTIIGDVTGSTAQLASAAEEMSAVTEQTSQGMKQQQAETDQIATAMNEMSATVQEVARNAAAAAQSAHQADDQASKGKQVVSQTIESIDALATEVEKAGQVIHKLEGDSVSIGAVLDVIKGIAEQTNLLALNAAIEAARAGEQGRGFAVVADEVRTLAQRTQQSTQEIRKMIESLQSGAKDAVKVMVEGKRQAQVSVEQAAKAGAALETITRAVATITDMNTQIASAAEEQSAVAEEMNRNIVNISQVANQTAEGGQQTASGAADVAQLAVRLQAAVGRFRL